MCIILSDVQRITKQPKFTAIIQLRRLTLFGHIAHMDDNADAKRILLASHLVDWRRQPGRPRITWFSTVQQDLRHHHLTLPEAAYLAQNQPLENDDDVWCYAILELHARKDNGEAYIVWSKFTHGRWHNGTIFFKVYRNFFEKRVQFLPQIFWGLNDNTTTNNNTNSYRSPCVGGVKKYRNIVVFIVDVPLLQRRFLHGTVIQRFVDLHFGFYFSAFTLFIRSINMVCPSTHPKPIIGCSGTVLCGECCECLAVFVFWPHQVHLLETLSHYAY